MLLPVCWQFYICCPGNQFLIKYAFPRAPCQFSLFLSGQSQFPTPSPIFMFLPILQAINPHCLCPSSLSHSLLSPTPTNFLPYWCFSAHWGPSNIPVLTVGAGSFPSLRGVYPKPSLETLLLYFLSSNTTLLSHSMGTPQVFHRQPLGFREA